MRALKIGLVVVVAVLFVGHFLFPRPLAQTAEQRNSAPTADASSAALIERGKYLVERVAMCIDCHSPRTPTGEFDQKRWLQGSVLDFAPRHPIPNWTDVAPAIAGLPGYTEEEAIRLLETGIAPNGKPLRPPMPPYRMNREDARAVVAYLKSLGKR